MPRPQPPGTVATNRRARHDYEILETIEAGIVLRGTEVKTLRQGKASLQDAYAGVEGDNVILHMQIPEYSHAGYSSHEPTRARKLLLHRAELDRWQAKVRERGYSIIPLVLYFRDGKAKIELGLARGKTHEDRRQDIKERDTKREMDRALRRR